MIRLTRVAAVGALAAAAALSVVLAAQSPYDTVLSAADVSKVTGISGIKLVPQGSQVGAGGTLNFARPDGKLVLMVNLGPAEIYRKARDSKEVEIGGKKYPNLLFAHNVPGVGDEAFASPPGPEQYIIYARKGDKGITVSTFIPSVGEHVKPLLTEAQLETIAQLIFSRE